MGEEFLKRQIEFSSSIDDSIESCQRYRLGLKESLKKILEVAKEELNLDSIFIFTYDEKLKKRFFFLGEENTPFKYNLYEYINLMDSVYVEKNGKDIYVQPLDIFGEKIGVIGFIASNSNQEELTILLDTFAEELDNYLYQVIHERKKQFLITKLNEAIRKQVFNDGLIEAIDILYDVIPFCKLSLIYQDNSIYEIGYKIFDKTELLFDYTNSQKHSKELRELEQYDANFVEKNFKTDKSIIFPIKNNSLEQENIGFVFIEPTDKKFQTYEIDLFRIFSEIVNYRLVDFHREQKILRRFFSQDITSRLLSDPEYNKKYLSPRVHEVAILFSDINSFTKISEQILQKPELIGHFVDYWSKLVVDIVFKNGGVFDKMVGDCVIAHFGPPFFENSPTEMIKNALKAAKEIQEATISMIDNPDFKKIKDSALIKGMGVATGINFAPLNVGFFGQNADYTGFSSGMNNTARLQSLATFRETLIMRNAKNIISVSTDDFVKSLKFSEEKNAMVKNVAEPLRYHHVIF
ncbi:adenylate/guanylate cyclase domain-containing protein [bacterium]|nr:adenylate/guanylate cyclase domain-containing protein [bacterium]